MRITSLTVLVWCAFATAQGLAYELRFPIDTSFITKLADAAIDAEGAEAVRDRGQSRRRFQEAFLGGWIANQDFVTSSLTPDRYSTRLHIKGWLAGMNYRSMHPDSAADIMREYGYTQFKGTGSWRRGAGVDSFDRFEMDEATMRAYGVMSRSCVDITFVYGDELRAKIRRIHPPEEVVLFGGMEVHVTLSGYISPTVKYKLQSPGEALPFECEREIIATHIDSVAR